MSIKRIVIIVALTVLAIVFYLFTRMESMFILWPNTVSVIVFILIAATVGFVIYGIIKGFDNLFPND